MKDVRNKYNFGRPISSSQIGIMKRLIYMNIDKPIIFINTKITYLNPEMFEVWDDCMSFTNLLVTVRKHKKLTIKYLYELWQQKELHLEYDLLELL